MNLPGFCGGLEQPISRAINPARTYNLYVESEGGTPKKNPVLIGRAALVPFTYCAPGPITGLFFQDGRMFSVSGNSGSAWLYEVTSTGNLTNGNTPLGSMAANANPASICSNGTGGNQLMVTSGGSGYILDLVTGTFQQITDAEFLTPSAMAMYFETYFLNLQEGTNTFQLSAQLDGLNWNGLDTGQCSTTSDQKFAMALTSRTIMFAGSKNIEPWYNSGNASFPIQPESGVVVEHGIAAPYSFVNLDNTLYWLGQDANGTGIVWRFNGYTPERVSNPAVENIIRQWPTRQDAIGFCFQISGRAYYCLYSTHNDTTLVYDVGEQVWLEWSRWDLVYMRHFPWPVRCACAGWDGRIFLGSARSGIIYELRMDLYEDEIEV